MAERRRSAWLRYGVALVSVAGATLLRYWLDPLLADAGFALFFVAVVIAAWFGGIGASLVALASSLIASTWLFSKPVHDAPEPAIRVLFGLSVFMFVAIATALLSESLRAAQRRAESQADEAVRQREQLRTTLACIGDAVIVSDRNGSVSMMNPVAEALTGWSSADAIGQSLDNVLCISNEQGRQAIERPVDKVLRDGIIVNNAHAILTAKDGRQRPIHQCAAPIRNESNNVTGVVIIMRDVTEQRRTEQALRDADRRKDEFLAILAHELRNPLAPICSAIEILANRSINPQAMDRAKEMLDRQVHHLVRLVDDLLDVSRIMRGKIDLRNELVDVRNVISRAVETCHSLIASKQHKLTISLPPEPLPLAADPVRLVQVVNNLLTNAAKYTEPGGCIWLSAEPSNDGVIIRIRDTGIGIPSEMLTVVFDLFTQVDSSVSRSQGGLGIGLTLVKSLVELSGGTIVARSDGPGKGSEFIVHLPIHSNVSEQPARPADIPTQSPPLMLHRILVADDNTDAAETLAMLLRLKGHEAIVAYDGPSALEAAAVHNPDMIFLDIGMPNMDGLEVARRLRQSSTTEKVILVALTGWGLEEDRRRTRAAGFDYHLVKPVSSDTINQLLNRQGTFSQSEAVA